MSNQPVDSCLGLVQPGGGCIVLSVSLMHSYPHPHNMDFQIVLLCQPPKGQADIFVYPTWPENVLCMYVDPH